MAGALEHPAPAAGVAMAIGAATLWGVTGAVAADLFSEVSPNLVTEVRVVAISLALLPYVLVRGMPRIRPHLRGLILLGLVLAGLLGSFYWAIDLLGVGPGATLQFLGPIYVLGWMRVVDRRPVPRIAWLAAVSALIGVGLLTEAGRPETLDIVGIGAGLAASLLFAAYLILAERLGRHFEPVTLTALGFTGAAVVWLVAEPIWQFPTDLTPRAWVQLAVIAVLGSVLPFTLEIAALRRAAAGIVGVVATTEPVVGGATAWIFLDQALTVPQVAGGLLVVGAVALVQRYAL